MPRDPDKDIRMSASQANAEIWAALESPIEEMMLMGIIRAAGRREWKTTVWAPCPRCNPDKRLDFSARGPALPCGQCLGGYSVWSYCVIPHSGDKGDVSVWIQRVVGAYRVDMTVEVRTVDLGATAGECFYRESPVFVVECDGKDYHTTPEQVARDKARDRQILTDQGWPTLRFTGSEIVRGKERNWSRTGSGPHYAAIRCGEAVLKTVTARWDSEIDLDAAAREHPDDRLVPGGPSPGGSLASEGRPVPAAGAAVRYTSSDPEDWDDDSDQPEHLPCSHPGCEQMGMFRGALWCLDHMPDSFYDDGLLGGAE